MTWETLRRWRSAIDWSASQSVCGTLAGSWCPWRFTLAVGLTAFFFPGLLMHSMVTPHGHHEQQSPTEFYPARLPMSTG